MSGQRPNIKRILDRLQERKIVEADIMDRTFYLLFEDGSELYVDVDIKRNEVT